MPLRGPSKRATAIKAGGGPRVPCTLRAVAADMAEPAPGGAMSPDIRAPATPTAPTAGATGSADAEAAPMGASLQAAVGSARTSFTSGGSTHADAPQAPNKQSGSSAPQS